MTLDELLDKTILLGTMSVSTNTQQAYLYADLKLRQLLGDPDIKDLDTQTIVRAYQSNHGLSNSTLRLLNSLLRKAFNLAVKEGVVASNPVPKMGIHARPSQVWDESQIGDFLREAYLHSDYAIVYLTALQTGMRLGELLALQTDDVRHTKYSPGGPFIIVQHTLHRWAFPGGVRHWQLEPPKSRAGIRAIAIPQKLYDQLGDWWDKHQHPPYPRSSYPPFIFQNEAGGPLWPSHLTQRDFPRVIRHARVPRIRFHDLRHTHATLLLKAGVNPKIVQERLGHSSIAITLGTYSHVLPSMQKEVVQKLDGLKLF
jgi:integrase